MRGKACCLPNSVAKKEEFARVSADDDCVFCITKEMDRTNWDVGKNCLLNDAGELALTDEYQMKAWVEHYATMLNVELEWPSKKLAPWGPPNYVRDPDPQCTW